MPNNDTDSVFENNQTMDVTAPGKTVPSPTARPVVVPGRSMVNADPMVARTVAHGRQTNTQPVPDVAPEAPKDASTEQQAVEPLAEKQPADTVSDTETVGTAHKEKVLAPIANSTTTDTTETPQPTQDTPAHATTPAAETEKQPPIPSEPEEESEALINLRQKFQGDKVPDSDLEAAKRDAELMSHVENGTYELQIRKNTRHTERLLVGGLIICLVLLVLVNFALDMGVIDITGVPHTNFL